MRCKILLGLNTSERKREKESSQERSLITTKLQVTLALQNHVKPLGIQPPISITGCKLPWHKYDLEQGSPVRQKGESYNGGLHRILREPTASGEVSEKNRVTGPERQMGGRTEQGSALQPGQPLKRLTGGGWLPTGFPAGQAGSRRFWERDLGGAPHIYPQTTVSQCSSSAYFDNLFWPSIINSGVFHPYLPPVSLGSFFVLLAK